MRKKSQKPPLFTIMYTHPQTCGCGFKSVGSIKENIAFILVARLPLMAASSTPARWPCPDIFRQKGTPVHSRTGPTRRRGGRTRRPAPPAPVFAAVGRLFAAFPTLFHRLWLRAAAASTWRLLHPPSPPPPPPPSSSSVFSVFRHRPRF